MTIIGLCGFAGSGKDTVADLLVASHGFEKVSFADPLREAAARLDPYVAWGTLPGEITPRLIRYTEAMDHYGYTRAKVLFPELRRVLQVLGTEVGRDMIDPNLWVNLCLASMTAGLSYVVADVRFPNEAEMIRKSAGVVVRVDRPGYGPVNDHPSETALNDDVPDFVIVNDGSIEDLAIKVKELVQQVEAD